MLKLKYLYENFDLAKLALENWEYDAYTLDAHLRHFRISSNAVYPFSWKGQMRFLRLSPVSEKMESNLKGELEFLCYLQAKGYPAATPVSSNSGHLVIAIDSAWGKYYASVFQGVDGIPLEEMDFSDHILFKYGQALGQLHVLSAEYCPVVRKWTYLDVLSWIESVLKEYRAPDKMRTELDGVRQALNELPQTSETFGLVHYDFEPDNVFWNETRKCCAAIDFEDSMYHFFLVDLEQALDALMDVLPADRRASARSKFLLGYQSIKTLEPGYAGKQMLMRRFCNLYSYARLVRCVAEQYPNEPDWMIGLREKLLEKVNCLENGIIG